MFTPKTISSDVFDIVSGRRYCNPDLNVRIAIEKIKGCRNIAAIRELKNFLMSTMQYVTQAGIASQESMSTMCT